MAVDASHPEDLRYRFGVAPRFSLPRAFEGRLERNGGVRCDDQRVLPQNDWRALESGELTSLVSDLCARDAVLSPAHLGLLQVPERLRAAWWAEAERSRIAPAGAGSFEGIFTKVVEFLRFKRLPLPDHVNLRVLVSVPGLTSTRVGPPGTQGLGFGNATQTAQATAGPPLACINFGDETAFVVLLELPPAALIRGLESIGEGGSRSFSPTALVRRYFEAFPRQRLLRVRLEPGEGLWLSPLGVVHDGWTEGKRDLDVMLQIGVETPTPASAESPATLGMGVPDRA